MKTPNIFDFNYQPDIPDQEDFPLNLREQARAVHGIKRWFVLSPLIS